MGISKKIKAFIFNRDGNKCLQCGRTDTLTMDHIVPKVRGGTSKPDNLQTLCSFHNCKKDDRIVDYRVSKELPPWVAPALPERVPAKIKVKKMREWYPVQKNKRKPRIDYESLLIRENG